MVHLQKLHERYVEKGLVVLGFNSADKREIALDLLRQNKVTYSTVLDASFAAQQTAMSGYRVSAVPTTYVIDRDGKIRASWTGGQESNPTANELLKKLGFE